MKILVVRVGRLGDIVMVTPALDELLARYPEAELTLLTSPEGRRVLSGFDPRVREFWEYRRGGLLPVRRHAGLRRRIRAAGFDRVFLFESRASYTTLVRDAAASIVSLPPRDPHAPPVHYAERCLRAVDAGAPPRHVRLPVSSEGQRRAEALLEQAGIGPGECVVGFHPAFAERKRLFGNRWVQRHKCWPASKWGELARRLADIGRDRGVPVRVLMDLMPEDRSLGDEIAALSGGAALLSIPSPDFERYKATVARMDLFVAPDTGPMHLAAAVGTPVVALFSGKDPADCGPYVEASRRVVLRAEDEVDARRLGLAALRVERVTAACERLLPAMA